MNKIITACLATLLFTACSEEKQPDHDSSLGTPDTTTRATPVLMPTDSPANSATTNILPGGPQPASITTPQQLPAQTTSTAAGMNPAHGQPGHRCDIAVGAPLNSAPAKPSTVTSTPVVTNTTPAAAKTVTAPGMNPPHGEPGHRCDIAVGAPLNSAAPKPVTPVTVTPTVTPAITPAKVDSGG